MRNALVRKTAECWPIVLLLATVAVGQQPRRRHRGDAVRCSVGRRRVSRRAAGVGRGRSGCHLAHRRRRTQLDAARLGRRLPSGERLLSRREARLGGRRLYAALHAHNRRRRAAHPRRRHHLECAPRSHLARRAADRLLRPPAWLGRGAQLGIIPHRRLYHRRRRTQLAGGSRHLDAELAHRRFDRREYRRRGRTRRAVRHHSPPRDRRAADGFRPARVAPHAAYCPRGRLARGRRRTDPANQRPGQIVANHRGSAAPGRFDAVRLPGAGRPRRARLGGRHARDTRISYPRWRPHLGRFQHRLRDAHSFADLRRPAARLGRRRLGTHSGHQRRRPHLAHAACRR